MLEVGREDDAKGIKVEGSSRAAWISNLIYHVVKPAFTSLLSQQQQSALPIA